jgi:excinuclease ABC subunit C
MRFKLLTKNKISKLPKSPGVYMFKDKKKILYIGKAANIRERVKNHFQQPGYKDYLFLDKIKKIGYIKTYSEIEALILEANLIKKYQPKYNVIWKDDKNYFFVGKTIEDFPRVFLTHQTKKPYPQPYTLNPKYVGPFVDGKALKQTLKVLRKVFPYRTCKNLPKRPCLWYHLGRCPAPCLIKTPKENLRFPTGQAKLASQIPGFREKIQEDCQRNAENIFKILRGEKIQVLKTLKKEMKGASKLEDFERAAKMRDQIESLEKVLANVKIFYELETNYVIKKPWQNYHVWRRIEKKLKKILKTERGISRIEAYDVSNIQGQEATGSMVTFINGLPEKNFYRKFKIKISGKPNDIAMLKETLNRRLNHPEWGMPDLILIDGGRAQLNVACQCLIPGVKQKMKVVALAKKENKLFVEGKENPILLKSLPREIFNLILQLRDGAHRFALTYHKKLREKVLLER